MLIYDEFFMTDSVQAKVEQGMQFIFFGPEFDSTLHFHLCAAILVVLLYGLHESMVCFLSG